ncbi:hypothetical protein JW710_00905 [Candidatus Dojkabacteria bacterium]|nr:hypothetical protein [Candidatus Dojkabacteria bacterium]
MIEQIKERLSLFNDISKLVGDQIATQFGLPHEYKDKGNFNQQTEADIYAEKTIVTGIKQRFPKDSIYSEEMGLSKGQNNLWVLDPLDGTSNYLAGLPIFSITATFIGDNGTGFSAFYYPILDIFVQAVKDDGVTINGKSPTKPDSKETGIISLIGGYAAQKEQEKAKKKLKKDFKRILSLWCPSYDALLLLRGQTDAIVAIKNETEDLLPGIILAQELGYKIKTLDGKNFEFKKFIKLLPTVVMAKSETVLNKILAKLN